MLVAGVIFLAFAGATAVRSLVREDAIDVGAATVLAETTTADPLDEDFNNWKMTDTKPVTGLRSTKEAKGFKLRIPSIGLEHNVTENVNPARESIYGPVIEQSIAHGQYTRLPDEATVDGNVYLFAHRTGNINGRDIGFFNRLDELGKGDKAYVSYAGKTYVYEAYKSFVITPEDTWVYTGQSDFPSLTLQTCENGEEQRLIVKFKLVRVEN